MSKNKKLAKKYQREMKKPEISKKDYELAVVSCVSCVVSAISISAQCFRDLFVTLGVIGREGNAYSCFNLLVLAMIVATVYLLPRIQERVSGWDRSRMVDVAGLTSFVSLVLVELAWMASNFSAWNPVTLAECQLPTA